jgi:ornithine--oxo-acid transaminase
MGMDNKKPVIQFGQAARPITIPDYHNDYLRYVAQNYAPEFIDIISAYGDYLVARDGKLYLDALQGYASGAFGHSLDEIVEANVRQITPPNSTKSYLNDHNPLPGTRLPFEPEPGGLDFTTNNICTKLKVQASKELSLSTGIAEASALIKNGGAESHNTAVNAIRRWGYRDKGIAQNAAKIIAFENCFHGRMPSAVSSSSYEGVRRDLGPYMPGFIRIPYGDIGAFKSALTANSGSVAGTIIEPIQGEAGVIIPPPGYMQALQDICKQENVWGCTR